MAQLTGHTRHRIYKPFLSKPLFVLQVEVKGFVPEPQGVGRDETWWLDAQAEHLTVEPEGK